MSNRPKPFAVMESPNDPMGVWTKLAEFDTAEEASEYINTFPTFNVERGDYSIDGPAEDWDENYTGWIVNSRGAVKWIDAEADTITPHVPEPVMYALPGHVLTEIVTMKEMLDTLLKAGTEFERSSELWLGFPTVPVRIDESDSGVVGEFRVSPGHTNEYVFFMRQDALEGYTIGEME